MLTLISHACLGLVPGLKLLDLDLSGLGSRRILDPESKNILQALKCPPDVRGSNSGQSAGSSMWSWLIDVLRSWEGFPFHADAVLLSKNIMALFM